MSRTKRHWGKGARENNSDNGSRKRFRFGKQGQPSQRPNNNDKEERRIDDSPLSDHPDDMNSKGAEAQDSKSQNRAEDPNASAPDLERKTRLAQHRKKIRSLKLNIKEREKALRKKLKKKRKSKTAPPPPRGSWLGTWNLYTTGPNNKSENHNTHILTLISCLHGPSSDTIDTDPLKPFLRCQHGHEINCARGILSLGNESQSFELVCFQVPDHASLDALTIPLRMCGYHDGANTMSIVFLGRGRMRASIPKSCLTGIEGGSEGEGEGEGELQFVGRWVE